MSTGSTLPLALDLADRIEHAGISCAVFSFHTVKPLDTDTICEAATASSLMIALEEHSVAGGFGSAVAEVVAELPFRAARFKRMGLPDGFSKVVGSHDFLLRENGLHLDTLTGSVEAMLADMQRSLVTQPAMRGMDNSPQRIFNSPAAS